MRNFRGPCVTPGRVSPEEIRALQKALRCSAGELARALKVEPKTVVQWESGELFPTKRHVDKMRELEGLGPSAIVRAVRAARAPRAPATLLRLADPKLWEIVRKLAAHPTFFDQVARLAAEHSEPDDEAG